VLKVLDEKGGGAGFNNDEDVYFQEKAGKLVLAKGASKVIRDSGSLNEAVLPDNTPRSVLADTVRYMLTLMKPEQELLIIDPYLFPPSLQNHPDPNYIPYIEGILAGTLAQIDRLRVATFATRHRPTEAAFHAMSLGKKAGLNIATKYTDVFHDRFWIADGVRGLFIGTSLNGIGKRYALTDCLRDEDAADIYARFKAIP
jgi:hypothetical protein